MKGQSPFPREEMASFIDAALYFISQRLGTWSIPCQGGAGVASLMWASKEINAASRINF